MRKQPNKPMVPTATTLLADHLLRPLRRHIGQPLCSLKTTLAAAAGFALVSAPGPAFAEVSDKATSIEEHWILALPMAAALLLMPRWRWWTALPLAFLLAALIHATMELPNEPNFGAGLLEEQGWPYFASLWSSDSMMVVALAIGGFLGWRRRPRTGVPSPCDERRSASDEQRTTFGGRRAAVTPLGRGPIHHGGSRRL